MNKHIGASVFIAVLLSGCGTILERNEIRKSVDEGQDGLQAKLSNMREQDRKQGAVVRDIDAVWIGNKTVKVSREAELPAVFSLPLRFAFPDNPTLSTIADRLAKISGVPVRVSPDALVPIEVFSAQRMGGMGMSGFQGGGSKIAATNNVQLPSNLTMSGPISGAVPSMANMGAFGGLGASTSPHGNFMIDQTSPFGGTLSDMLDQASAKFGVGWDYKDGGVLISRLVTRTYQVASIGDVNNLNSKITKSGGSGNSRGSGGTGGVTQVGEASSSSDVSADVTAKIDIINGIQTAIEGALTPSIGKVSISTSGIITVSDTREVQELVRELIDAENKSIGRQIRMRMQIIDLTATTNNDTGFDWAWVINEATKKWNVDFFAPDGLPGGSTGNGQIGVIRNGDNSTSSAFLKALATVGKVEIQKDETFMLMNNRPHSAASESNFIYPARSTPAASVSDSVTSASNGVEPGQLTTGTYLTMRSSIQPNGSVIVQFSLDASLRGDTKTFVSNGVTLQYPESTANKYQFYGAIVSGQTAVLAAIDNTQRQSTDKSFDSTLTPLLGGGIATSTQRRTVLILLTPQIIEGVN